MAPQILKVAAIESNTRLGNSDTLPNGRGMVTPPGPAVRGSPHSSGCALKRTEPEWTQQCGAVRVNVICARDHRFMETEPSFRTCPVDPQSSLPDLKAERTSVIRVWRARNPWVNLLARYFVIIDGQKVGAIRRGETCDFSVSPGQHTVKLVISRIYSSNTVPVVTQSGETATMTCRPSRLAAVPLLGLFLPPRYISLELLAVYPPA